MADNNDKLSLHIAKKNWVAANTGFKDISVDPMPTRLSLNKQTVSNLGGRGGDGGTNRELNPTAWARCVQVYLTLTCQSAGCASFAICVGGSDASSSCTGWC